MQPHRHCTFIPAGLVFGLFLTHGHPTATAQVVINEVSVKPASSAIAANDQSLKDCVNPSFGREYIELYNPDPCNAVDIGCFILATPRGGVSTGPQGAFRFPPGTTIPPLGFVSIGGALTGASFILPSYCTGPNAAFMGSSLARWFLDNADHFVALYNDVGAPLDVVYWTFGANQANRWNNPDYPGLSLPPTVIPNPPSCDQINQLAGPGTIPAALVNYAGASPALGTVLHRDQDGGLLWETNAQGTLNNCNGICATPVAFTYDATVTQPTCGTASGSIAIIPAGTGPYTYTWTPSVSATNIATGLAAGSYEVVIELNGCQSDTIIELAATNFPTAVQVTVADANCGADDGVITLSNVTGGTAPFAYQLNGGAFTPNTAFPNLAPGTYTITVQDANGCTFTTTAAVDQTNAPTAVQVTVADANCGADDGVVTLGNVTGGTAPFAYQINGGSFTPNTAFPNLAPGTYIITVQDANGCTFTTTAAVGEDELDLVTTIQTSFEGCAEDAGSVEVLVLSGGTAPYLFSFGDGPFTPTSSATGLSTGIQIVRIRDANDCEWMGSFNIPAPDAGALVFAPNSFTPNGDGVNDEWDITGACIESFECRIFDRWGTLIATLTAEDPKWDGSVSGQAPKTDLYVYLLNVQGLNGIIERYRGSIMLLQ
jgi:gliding motility-associated-like protein